MAWTPISNTVPQYAKNAGGAAAADYYIKFYQDGTTTPTNMATDSTGGTTLAKCQLTSLGYPSTDGTDTNIFIPHIDQVYKLALYTNATDADNNTLASAVWVIDNLEPVSTLNSITSDDINHDRGGSNINLNTYLNDQVQKFDTVAAMVAASLEVGQTVRTLGYLAQGDGGGNYYDVVAAATGTVDGGEYIDLATHQAKGLFLDGKVTLHRFGGTMDGVADDRAKLQKAVDYADTAGLEFDYYGTTLIDCSSTQFDFKAITFRGRGRKDSLIKVTPPASGNAMSADTLDSLEISAIRFESTVAKGGATTPILMKVRNCTNAKVSGNLIKGGYFGLDVDSDDVDLTVWSASLAVTSAQEVQHQGNVYSAGSTGTTGSTAPVHSSGTASDGVINWTFERTIYENNQGHIIRDNDFDDQDSTGCVIDGVLDSLIDGNKANNCGSKGSQVGDGFKIRGLSKSNTITNNSGTDCGREGFDCFDGLLESVFTGNRSIRSGLQGFEFKGNYGGASSQIDDYVCARTVISGNISVDSTRSGFSWNSIRNVYGRNNVAIGSGRHGHELLDVKECDLEVLGARNTWNGVKLLAGTSTCTRNIIHASCNDNSWSTSGVATNYLGFDGLSIEYPCDANTIMYVRSGNGTTSTDYGNQAHGVGFSDKLTITMTAGAITDFLEGEQLDFGTSGAVARFDRYEGTAIYYTVVSGTPQNSETVTGAASSAAGTTASVSTTVTNANHFVSANLVGNDTADFNNSRENDSFVDAYINNTGLLQRPLRSYSDATRPSASIYDTGYAIWNTDDNAPNYVDGSSWRLADGTVT